MPPPTADPNVLAARLDEILSTPELPALIDRYFDPSPQNPFPGTLFDTIEDNDPYRFTAADLAAAAIIGNHATPQAARELLYGDACREQLAHVDPSWSIVQLASDSEVQRRTSNAFIRTSLAARDARIAPVLLARKRPNLLPIMGRACTRTLGVQGVLWHASLGEALGNGRLARFDQFARPARISALRVLDVALWMLGSTSAEASQARRDVGYDAPP